LRERFVALLDSGRGVQSALAKSVGKTASYFSEIRRGNPVNATHLRAVGIVFGGEKVQELLGITNISESASVSDHLGDLQERLLEIVSEFANGKHTVFAKRAGISPSTFLNYLNGRMPSAESLIAICETYGVSITWILTGQGDKLVARSDQPPDRQCVFDIEHCGIVKRFQNKELAISINRKLVQLEEVDPGSLREIHGYIKRMLTEAGAKKADGDADKNPQANGTNGSAS